MLFGLAVIVVAVIAAKRNGLGIAFLYLIGMCAIGFGLVVLASNITNGNGVIAGFTAFIAPILGLLIVLSSSTSDAEQCLMVSLVSIKNVLSAPSLSAKRPLNVNTVEVILNRPEYYQ
ncbi:phage-related membrane protein [Klebsiella pneumoniae RYC492]|nr:phage-related membrane protein [Klebsiella pneumoniae RYC492]